MKRPWEEEVRSGKKLCTGMLTHLQCQTVRSSLVFLNFQIFAPYCGRRGVCNKKPV